MDLSSEGPQWVPTTSMLVGLACLVMAWSLGRLQKANVIPSWPSSSSSDGNGRGGERRKMEQFEAMLRKEMWQDEAMESTTKASRQALGLSDLDAVSKARLGLVGMCAVALTNGIAESFGPVAASVWLIVGGYAAKLTYEKAAGTGKTNSNSNKGELNGGSRSSDSRSTGGSGSGGASSRGNGPLPVTVVTGFLGSGKTTFVKRLLAEEHGKKYLVIENELGVEGVDHDLLVEDVGREQIILLSNGCICCKVRADLQATLKGILAKPDLVQALDGVIIETTGLADPGPVVTTFFMDAELKKGYKLNSVVTVVDAFHVTQHLTGGATQHAKTGSAYAHNAVNEAHEQIAFADVVLLNKIDLIVDDVAATAATTITGGSGNGSGSDGMSSPSDRLRAVVDRVQSINATATIIPCTRSVPSSAPGQPPPSPAATSIAALLSLDAFDPKKIAQFDAPDFKFWDVGSACSPAMTATSASRRGLGGGGVRGKGAAGRGSSSSSDVSGLFAESQNTAGEVVTFSIGFAGSVDLDAFNMWIAPLLQAHGSDIFRTKGMLSIDGRDEKFVFHSVHMVFEGITSKGLKWADAEERRSRIVLIGRLTRAGLTHERLEREFKACAAAAGAGAARHSNSRLAKS